MFVAGSTIRLRAKFFTGIEAVDVGEPVNFYVKKRTASAETEGPFIGFRSATGAGSALYTPPTAGTYDFSVVTADGTIEEGEFIVKRRRAS